jgi:Domain of unknown function (DUF1995)
MWQRSTVNDACMADLCQTVGRLVRRFGQSAAKAEAYLRGFETSYFLQRLDIEGEDVRLLRAYPSQWQVRLPLSTTVLSFGGLLHCCSGICTSNDWRERSCAAFGPL